METRLVRKCDGTELGVIHLFTVNNPTGEHPSHAKFCEDAPFKKIVGSHPTMRRLSELVQLVAKTAATVHIYGENGTGKELLAEAIHEQSPRKGKRLVRLNCSTIPGTLLESTLFGHAKGAFTGAQKDQQGFLEVAEGGTIFLDEIGDISLEVQVKLLRVLQSREYSRVGETRIRKADVRIITATNRDLKKLVAEAKLREDFYYRILVFPLVIPPLRERKSDISLLVQHFLGLLNTRYKKSIERISSQALECLMRHAWPGNVRELENALEYAFVLDPSTEIGVEHLPKYLSHDEQRHITGSENTTATSAGLSSNVVYSEREQILAALRKTGGKKAEAAKILGYSRITLWKKLKGLGPINFERPTSF
jgi:transcriptional regulator with PAS, ATPase and Fis domain